MLAEENRDRNLNLRRYELGSVIHPEAKNTILKLTEIDRTKLEGFVPLLACCCILFLLQFGVHFNEELFVGVLEFTLRDP